MPTSLDVKLCRVRQQRLCDHLHALKLDGALITDPRHVFYLTGYWRVGRPVFACAAALRSDGRMSLITALPNDAPVAADEVMTFDSNRIGTLIDDQHTAMMNVLLPRLMGVARIGWDQAGLSTRFAGIETVDLAPAFRAMRRTKDADEVALLRVAIRAAEAAYEWVRAHAAPGMNEVDLYAGLGAAAVRAAGEPIVELGNDFQSGSLGGSPRNRAVLEGEAFILDIAVGVRGYSSDLCRTFIIGAEPTDAQLRAHTLVMKALAHVESRAKPGVSCKTLHEEVREMIAGREGWVFPHHLGHGIGLSAHEAPRLNPHWDDTLQVGDVFTAEPGLYGDALRTGVRVEEDYLVIPGGIEKLSSYSTRMARTIGRA